MNTIAKQQVTLSEFTRGVLIGIWFNPDVDGYVGKYDRFQLLKFVFNSKLKRMLEEADLADVHKETLQNRMQKTANDLPKSFLFQLSARRLEKLASQL